MDAGRTALAGDAVEQHWRRNLAVCVVGSFTTLVSMTLLLPTLPLFVASLGARGEAADERWAAAAYSATFLTAGATAPVWGRLADRYGRKPMLVRASAGMAVATCLVGLVRSPAELVAVRALIGLLGGYSSGSTILVAAQTPRERSAWALGVLSTGVLAGTVAGPLLGGVLPSLVGLRATFLASGGAVLLASAGTVLLLREDRRPRPGDAAGTPAPRARRRLREQVDAPGQVLVLLVSAGMLLLATVSVEPVLALYVRSLGARPAHVGTVSGVVLALGAAGSIASAARWGRLADRVGHPRVLVGCLAAAGVVVAVQATATSVVELAALRLLGGVCLGGLLPVTTAALRHRVVGDGVGAVLGWSVSAQYAGQVVGPALGAVVAAHLGLRAVFLATGLVLLAGAALDATMLDGRVSGRRRSPCGGG